MTTAFGGGRKGIFGAIGGGLVGMCYKVIGDMAYESSKTSWLRFRVHALNSPQRILEIKKPQFPPKNVDGSYQKTPTKVEDLDDSHSLKPAQYTPDGREFIVTSAKSEKKEVKSEHLTYNT